MTSPRLDIAICGCGPAGLASALFLKRAGHRVSLFERFVQPEPLGSGLMLQPTGLAVLANLGLRERMLSLGHRVERMFGRVVPSGRVVLDVKYGALAKERFSLAVHRAALFRVLFDAVEQSGISIEGNFELAAMNRGADLKPLIVDKHGRKKGPFDLVVDATGSNSPLTKHSAGDVSTSPLAYGALWTTLPWPGTTFSTHTLEQRYRRASVMIGVLPVGRRAGSSEEECAFFWSLKFADYQRWRSEGLARWKDDVRSLWPETEILLQQISSPDQMVFARYDHRTLAKPFGDRTVFVGDSAHSTSPQLGQGANMALLDAFALSDALEKEPELDKALKAYARKRRFHVRLYQMMSRVFTPFYQSDSRLLPFMRDALFAQVSGLPVVPGLLAGLVGGSWGLDLEKFGLGANRAEQ